MQWVFGFGSLVHKANLCAFLGRTAFAPGDVYYSWLHGFSRSWNAAWDNTIPDPTYKYYCDATTGERATCCVTFLNIDPAPPNHSINGIVFRVSPEDIALLDKRERNYHRIDVTGKVSQAVNGTVWTYTALDIARKCFQQGVADGRSAISRSYFEGVAAGFRAWGEDALRTYQQTTTPRTVPLRDLWRIDR